VLNRLKALRQTDPTLAYRKKLGSVLGVAGDPDIYGVWAGIPFFFELKKPGANPTPLQLARLAEWKAAGAVTAVIRSLADLDEALREVVREVATRRG
jgi:hypothetical protein